MANSYLPMISQEEQDWQEHPENWPLWNGILACVRDHPAVRDEVTQCYHKPIHLASFAGGIVGHDEYVVAT